MFTLEDLCRKGFYGVRIEEIPKSEITQIIKTGKVEIVTPESVKRVRSQLDPALFEISDTISDHAFLRPTNKEFTNYATNGRLKFNCSEYYFIFHALITCQGPVECNSLRTSLKIGAKSFFYFIKKLSMIGLVKKVDNKLLLTKDAPVVVKKKKLVEFDPPTNLLRNVPIYTQIKRMLAREEGISTQEIQGYLGMANRKANKALMYVLETDYKDEVRKVVEFEGKTRRNRYILNKHYEKQKKELEKKDHTKSIVKKPKVDLINTEIRTKAIEDLVLKEKAIMYNKHFHQTISDILGSKHTIDKNTVIRTANASSAINMVQVYLNYPTKTITRNVFKISSMSPTAPEVIKSIEKEGYRKFSIVTNKGVIDYAIGESYEDDMRIFGSGKSIEEHEKYYRRALFEVYEEAYASVHNGYLLNKQDRAHLLLEYWKKNKVEIEKTYQTVEDLTLSVLLGIFAFSDPKLSEKIDEYLSHQENSTLENTTYKQFRSYAPVELSRYFTSKKLVAGISEYIDDLINSKNLEEINKDAAAIQRYKISKKEPGSKKSDSDSDNKKHISRYFLPKEERSILCSRMCREYVERTDKSMSISLLKHIRLGVAMNAIISSDHSKMIKSELSKVFVKNASPKKTYLLTNDLVKIETPEEKTPLYSTLCSTEYKINKVAFSPSSVLKCLFSMKEGLINNGTIFLADLEDDYFLCEFVALSLHRAKVLAFSKSSVKNNLLLCLRITDEYKNMLTHTKTLIKKVKEKKAYLQTFNIPFFSKIEHEKKSIYYSTFMLYVYLLHNGSTPVHEIARKQFFTQAEIDSITSTHPEIFTIHCKTSCFQYIVSLALD